MNNSAKKLIEKVAAGDNEMKLIEEVTVTKSEYGGTRMSDSVNAKAKPIIEEHMKQLGEALDKEGIRFSIDISDCYTTVHIK
jgi:hypothetical protein